MRTWQDIVLGIGLQAQVVDAVTLRVGNHAVGAEVVCLSRGRHAEGLAPAIDQAQLQTVVLDVVAGLI